MGTALQKLESICAEIYGRWDADQRSGKLLAALAGGLQGYRQDVTDVRAALDANERLRAAFMDAARLLTLEQLQQLSEQSAHVLADLGLLTHEQAARAMTPREEELVQKALLASSEKVEK